MRESPAGADRPALDPWPGASGTNAMTPAQAAALVSVMDRLSRAVRIEEVADVVVEDGGDALGADGDFDLYVWGDDDAHLEHLRSRFPRNGGRARATRIAAGRRTPATYAALTGEPLWFASRDEYLTAYPDGLDLVGEAEQALAVLPLSTRERTFGAVAVRWSEARAFDDDERTYHMTLCRIFAQALDRGRLVEEQRLARERAESSERRSRLLAEAGALLTMSLVEDEIYRRAAEIAVPAFADWCVFDVVTPSGELRRALVHHRERALADEVDRVEAMKPVPQLFPWLERALLDAESQLVTDVSPRAIRVRAGEERARLTEALGVRSFIVVPLLVRGRVEGLVTFVRGAGAPPYVTDDLTLGEDLTHRAALAVENARLFHAERRLTQDVQRLQRISEGLTVAVSPDDVAEVVVEHGRPALGAADGILVLHDERRGCFRLNGGGGAHPRPRPRGTLEAFPLDPPSALGEAVLHGEPAFLESEEEWRARYPTTEPPYGPPGARVALPLRAGDKVLGALGYAFDGPRRFSSEDREFLVAVARQCSLALERARLYAEQAKAREQTLMLLRVTSALALTQTTDEVAEAVVEDVLEIVGSDGGYLGLLEPDGGVVALRKSGAPLVEGEEERVRLHGRSPIRDVLERGQPLFFTSAAAYRDAYPPSDDGLDLEASAILAISAGGRTIGALALRFPSQRGLDEDLVQLLEAVAIQCGDAFERAELLEREAEARRGAEVANRAKDEFLAMLGHELRNPLMPIVTALSLMRIKGDEHFVKERAMIERQAQHLLRLVDDLLDVSRITRGKIDLRRRRTDLAEVVRHAMETTSPLLEQRHHHVDVQLDEELFVDGDENRLVQVVANLLSNAAKYTEPEGHISVRCQLERGEVVLRVKDSGVGIDPQLLPRVFDLFVQGARGIDRAQGGLGLGLSLVKSITVLHGGRVEVHSAGAGRGTEFVVRLPHAPSREGVTAPGPAMSDVSESPPRAPLRILVVDDNVDAADSLAETLAELGHETAVAYDGPEGLAKARALDPEVALLDIGLPVMDGYELARSLQKEHGEHLTLIAVTGYGQPADRARAKAAGFHHHFVKPIHLAGLLALLQRVGVEQHPA